jgi:hypothetical protein
MSDGKMNQAVQKITQDYPRNICVLIVMPLA